MQLRHAVGRMACAESSRADLVQLVPREQVTHGKQFNAELGDMPLHGMVFHRDAIWADCR